MSDQNPHNKFNPGDRVTTTMGLSKDEPGTFESYDELGWAYVRWDSGGVSKLYPSQIVPLDERKK